MNSSNSSWYHPMLEKTPTAPEKHSPSRIPSPPRFKAHLPYFWICDCSESMKLKETSGDRVKMDTVNKIMPLIIDYILNDSKIGRFYDITMRTIQFSDTAEWVDCENIPVKRYRWKDLFADGATALGDALAKVAETLQPMKYGGTMPDRANPPFLVLITDGYPTDDWEKGLARLNAEFWGKSANRIAVTLEGADEDMLRVFIGEDNNAANKIISLSDLNGDDITLDLYDGPFQYNKERRKGSRRFMDQI